MIYNAKQEDWVYYHLQTGPENLSQRGYAIYNLKELPDGGYGALLVFTADRLLTEDGEGYWRDENGGPYMEVVAYPVKASVMPGNRKAAYHGYEYALPTKIKPFITIEKHKKQR